MTSDLKRAQAARKILDDREERYVLFPSDIFDEYAWNMLLHLFVAFASNEVVPETSLIKAVHTSRNIGQRWLYQLAKDNQVRDRASGDDVSLTDEAIFKLRSYLDTV